MSSAVVKGCLKFDFFYPAVNLWRVVESLASCV